MPAPFAAAMRSVIVPGTTLMTTEDPLSSQSTGARATLLDADDAKT
jgi:hypothetical protein